MFAASISPQVLDMHRRGKIRILVAGSDRHLAGAPEIPISVEVGFPDLDHADVHGRVRARRHAAADHRPDRRGHARKRMADKEFQKKLIKAGFEPVTDSGPEQTAKFVQEELVRWTPLLKAAGIKMN